MQWEDCFPACQPLALPAFPFPETQAPSLHLPLSPYPFLPRCLPLCAPRPFGKERIGGEIPRQANQTAAIKSNFCWVHGFPLWPHHTLLTPHAKLFRSPCPTGRRITSVHAIIPLLIVPPNGNPRLEGRGGSSSLLAQYIHLLDVF